ncbi:glycosyl hydrolase [Alsobacter sp. KACC 23698]|uniref:Glycosyl hydrolase n=1 Tax=Alsobacter sp. KACC 23698 TaxID=3149229 RepID=A0AAU7JJR2_9HYPH
MGDSVDFVRAHTGRADWADWDGSIAWESQLWAGTGRPIAWSIPLFANQGNLASAASGAYDSHYRQAAETILAGQAHDAAISIRMGEEFNSDWMPWSAAKGQEQNFIAAYRHFVDAFRSVSDKFQFEWNVNLGGSVDPAAAYPGDAYVDVIGMDFYYNTQWDSADPNVAWAKKVSEPFGLQWHQDFAAAHGKPTAYSEWGMNSDAPAYVTKAAQWFADHHVLYQSYWDVNDNGYRSEIGQYAGASTAFKKAFGQSDGHSQAPAPAASAAAAATDAASTSASAADASHAASPTTQADASSAPAAVRFSASSGGDASAVPEAAPTSPSWDAAAAPRWSAPEWAPDAPAAHQSSDGAWAGHQHHATKWQAGYGDFHVL